MDLESQGLVTPFGSDSYMPFEDNGFAILDTGLDISELYTFFESHYLSKFSQDASRNRNLIKIFTNDPFVRSILLAPRMLEHLRTYQKHPVATGPVVSHWTSTDATGSGFGLPFHQDWPSMATSSRSIVCWLPLKNVDQNGHSIEVIPGSHTCGALPGKQTDVGYLVEEGEISESEVLELTQGQVLFMSAWLVHRTFVNPACPPADFKLSLSQRFDDLEDPYWRDRNFVSAYHNAVDRDLWRQ
jgi:hypothetical protein